MHASSGKNMRFDMISHAEISEAEKREGESESSSEEESNLSSDSDEADVGRSGAYLGADSSSSNTL